MKNLIVCYDVIQRKLNEESVYYDIEKTLSDLGKIERLQESVFLVKTEETEQFVFRSVKETIGQEDSKILVVDITGRKLLLK